MVFNWLKTSPIAKERIQNNLLNPKPLYIISHCQNEPIRSQIVNIRSIPTIEASPVESYSPYEVKVKRCYLFHKRTIFHQETIQVLSCVHQKTHENYHTSLMTSQFTGLVLTIVTLFSLFPTSMWAINNYYDEKYHLVYVSVFIILIEIALFTLGLVIVYTYFKRILIWKNSEALLLTAHGHDTSPPSYIHPPNYPPSTVQEVQEIQEIRIDQN